MAVAAPYAALVPGDEFEQLVASRLGIDSELAAQLLARAREQYGDAEYDARAAAFALAVRDPVAAVMPDSARRKAVDGLLEPMLSAPASNLAYAVTGTDPGSPACAGLVRRELKTVEADIAVVGSGICGLLASWQPLQAGMRVIDARARGAEDPRRAGRRRRVGRRRPRRRSPTTKPRPGPALYPWSYVYGVGGSLAALVRRRRRASAPPTSRCAPASV